MNSREVALNIINRVLNEGAYSNIVLSAELNESDLNENGGSLNLNYSIDANSRLLSNNKVKISIREV